MNKTLFVFPAFQAVRMLLSFLFLRFRGPILQIRPAYPKHEPHIQFTRCRLTESWAPAMYFIPKRITSVRNKFASTCKADFPFRFRLVARWFQFHHHVISRRRGVPKRDTSSSWHQLEFGHCVDSELRMQTNVSKRTHARFSFNTHHPVC